MKLLIAIGTVCAAFLGILIVAPLSTLFGAVAGWAVGLFFGGTVLGLLGQVGVHDVTMWQVGAFLGFLAAFFKNTQVKS
jgi:hypothetical protein